MKTMTVRVRLWFAIASLSISVLGFAGCSDRSAEYQEFFERGNAYQAEGRDSEAIIEYRNALQADPNQAAAHEALAKSGRRVKACGLRTPSEKFMKFASFRNLSQSS